MTGLAGRRAAFLDRDGVINVDTGYVSCAKDFTFADGAKIALARLVAADFLLVVVTNQSGIGRGYFTEADFEILTKHMCAELAAAGAPVARVFHCPHLPHNQQTAEGGPCNCRKPAPGMILAAAEELLIDLGQSILIGDKASDMEAGRSAKVGRCFLVNTDRQVRSRLADACFPSLNDCVNYVLN